MAAVAGRDEQSGTFRIGSDPKISIMSIAIETNAREYNWGIRERGKRVGQKMAHLVFLLFRHDALGFVVRALCDRHLDGASHPVWAHNGKSRATDRIVRRAARRRRQMSAHDLS